MAPRANWKGFLKVGELNCAVALYTAASTSERIAFHMVNRDTGHRLNREFVDIETGKPVERDEQIKGYEVTDGDYVTLEPEEIAAAVPEADKMLDVQTFIACADIDDVYFDKPYYLAPTDKESHAVFDLIRDGLEKMKVAAIAETVLFRRARTVLIRPHGMGLVASTLNYVYEVRSAEQAFDDLPDLKLKDEMLELATHIIDTKKGKFDPGKFDDRYEEALAEMVKAKIEGKEIKKRPEPKETKASDLMEALRQSAGAMTGKPPPKARTKSAASKEKAPARSAKIKRAS
ncbi:MAG: Ku78, Ku70 and Ku80 are 70kDa and 80kDa subunit of the Lupus Ku autoantigen [Rhizobium sp.]|nr:Ku78, Ku70 and Ku80 are 70kDa and 80kDa subunit of the Lupus Ku autoantigen [Rhizobium sp.]